KEEKGHQNERHEMTGGKQRVSRGRCFARVDRGRRWGGHPCSDPVSVARGYLDRLQPVHFSGHSAENQILFGCRQASETTLSGFIPSAITARHQTYWPVRTEHQTRISECLQCRLGIWPQITRCPVLPIGFAHHS